MNPDKTYKHPSLFPGIYPRKEYWDRITHMANRMAVSQQKYGDIDDNYPDPGNAIQTAFERIELYLETRNVEWLVDAANMLIIESIRPSLEEAHFRATDSDESPGIKGLTWETEDNY